MSKQGVWKNRLATHRGRDHFRWRLATLLATCWIGIAQGQTSFNVTDESGFNSAVSSVNTQSTGDTGTQFSINIGGGFTLTAPFSAFNLGGAGNFVVVTNPASTITLTTSGTAVQSLFSSLAGSVSIVNSGTASLLASNTGATGGAG
ncbi:MAG: hypothetical protein WCD79_11795, partial [Chthoniobacteraceae bacterium]